MKLSIVGLGKLGLCFAASFAAKGFEVMGVDINQDAVEAINRGKAPFYEPELQETIDIVEGRLKASQSYEGIIKNSDVTFLILPTPSSPNGSFSEQYLQDALRHLALELKMENKPFHLFVVISTVSPGTIEMDLVPLIESVSGKELNKDFGICYNPEFVALGSVIKDFLNPDMVLIGESNKTAGDQLKEIYEKTCDNNPYIARMSIVSAEITKISLNAYMTLKISFANTLANICENIPNADVDAMTKALGADKRISPYYLKGGLAFGGPCFPRDTKAFTAFAKRHGIDAHLAKAADKVNEFQTNHLVHLLFNDGLKEGQKSVAILGLAYKPNTPVIEESPAVKLIHELLNKKVKVTVYDPLAMGNVKSLFGEAIGYARSAKECVADSSICIITTPLEEFKRMDDSFIVQNPTTIIDCWRILDPKRFRKEVKYIAVGRYLGGNGKNAYPAVVSASLDLDGGNSGCTPPSPKRIPRPFRKQAVRVD